MHLHRTVAFGVVTCANFQARAWGAMDFGAEGDAFDVKEWINRQFPAEGVESRAAHNLVSLSQALGPFSLMALILMFPFQALTLQSQHADLTDGMEQASKQLFQVACHQPFFLLVQRLTVPAPPQALPKTTKEISFIQKEASHLREALVEIVKVPCCLVLLLA
jgi:hypothetical protein